MKEYILVHANGEPLDGPHVFMSTVRKILTDEQLSGLCKYHSDLIDQNLGSTNEKYTYLKILIINDKGDTILINPQDIIDKNFNHHNGDKSESEFLEGIKIGQNILS